MPSLSELQKVIHDTAKEKGWWDKDVNVPEKLMLMVSEIAEALEEFRSGNDPDLVYCNAGVDKPEGVPVELADCIIRILDFCGNYEIDMEKIMLVKMEYNKTRAYRHGNKKA